MQTFYFRSIFISFKKWLVFLYVFVLFGLLDSQKRFITLIFLCLSLSVFFSFVSCHRSMCTIHSMLCVYFIKISQAKPIVCIIFNAILMHHRAICRYCYSLFLRTVFITNSYLNCPFFSLNISLLIFIHTSRTRMSKKKRKKKQCFFCVAWETKCLCIYFRFVYVFVCVWY